MPLLKPFEIGHSPSMGVEDQLQALRADFPGCAIVAFADLGTRIVLVSASEGTARRDTLDGLCAGAVELFTAAQAAGEEGADLVLRSHLGKIELALRDPASADEALCAICAPETDVDGFIERARAVLNDLGQDGAPGDGGEGSA